MVLVIIMSGAIIALIISLMMIFFVIYKGHTLGVKTFYCRKSEFLSMTEDFPDDCIIQIWIGRNTYESYGSRNPRRGNLRDNLPE